MTTTFTQNHKMTTMGYKKDDKCLKAAFDQEPIFVLLARDITAPEVIFAWIKANLRSQNDDKLKEASATALQMRSEWGWWYQQAHPEMGPVTTYNNIDPSRPRRLEDIKERGPVDAIEDLVCDIIKTGSHDREIFKSQFKHIKELYDWAVEFQKAMDRRDDLPF